MRIDMKIEGLIIKEAREAKKMSQADVAKEFGYTLQFVSNIERGFAKLPPAQLKVFRRVFGSPSTLKLIDARTASFRSGLLDLSK
jgi:transcriptional regulator with XRE-family HTH domain